jgi:hypothetical protein
MSAEQLFETVVAELGDDQGVGGRRCSASPALKIPQRRIEIDGLAFEDFVEGAAELAVAVVDQEPNRARAFRE